MLFLFLPVGVLDLVSLRKKSDTLSVDVIGTKL